MQTFTWNQAIPHLRHFNNATKPPCILLLGVYSSDTAGFRDERLGMVGGDVGVGYESKSWRMEKKETV